MRLLSIYKTAERSVPPSQEEIAKMGKPALLEVCASLGAKTLANGLPDRGDDLVEEGMKGGVLLAVEGCLPSALGHAFALERHADVDRRAVHGI